MPARQLFKGKKLIYPASVPMVFVGDYAGLQRDATLTTKWTHVKELQPDLTSGEVHFADRAKKINRKDGTMADRIIVLTPKALFVCAAAAIVISHLICARRSSTRA